MHYEIKKIWGIDCIFAPMQESNSLTIEISIKAGSHYESQQEAGISHVLEHMFFKGGKKWSTPKAVAIAMDSIGATFNAGTGESSTSYYIKSAPQFANLSLEMLADMLLDAQFATPELEREKGVIIQELKMYEDNPISVLHEKWQHFFFGDSSYGRPIIGFEENILSFTREQLIAYKNELYTKDNLLITIAGHLENQAELERKIEELFSKLPEKKKRQKPEFQWQLPQEKSAFFSKKTEQNHLIISLPWFSGRKEERYAAKLLCTILGGNMSSRLFQEIREKLGLCYYIGAGHSADEEFGIFSIRAGLDKEKFWFWQEKIHEVLDQMLTEGITDEEFKNAKNYLKGNIQMGIESSDEMAWFLGNQYLLYGRILSLDELLAKYEAVSKQQVEALFPILEKENRWSFHIE